MNPIKKWNQLGLFTRIMVGFVLGIAAGLILGEKATKTGVSWNHFNPSSDHGGCAVGPGTSDLFRSGCKGF